MTQNQVIEKLSKELAGRMNDLIQQSIDNEDLSILRDNHQMLCKTYIQMALAIGVEHFTKDMEEIIVLTYDGREIDRTRSISEAVKKTGIPQPQISDVLRGAQFSAGGLRFIKVKDKRLVPAKKTA